MKTENILTGIKFALGTIAGIGVSALVNTFAGTLTDKMKPIEKLCVGFASAVVGGMVAEQATEYIDKKVDGVMDTVAAIQGVMDQATVSEEKNEESEPNA